MPEAIFDFADIRKRTFAFADTPPQNTVTAPVAPPEPAEGWHVYWQENLYGPAVEMGSADAGRITGATVGHFPHRWEGDTLIVGGALETHTLTIEQLPSHSLAPDIYKPKYMTAETYAQMKAGASVTWSEATQMWVTEGDVVRDSQGNVVLDYGFPIRKDLGTTNS